MGNFVISRSIGIAIIIAITIILVLLVIIALRLSKVKHIHNLTDLEYQKVKERYKVLEDVYNSSLTTLSELTGKYDELNKNKESMKKLAYTDYLTELPNRAAFTEMLDNIMLTIRNEETIAIMDIDIDNFKNINDTMEMNF